MARRNPAPPIDDNALVSGCRQAARQLDTVLSAAPGVIVAQVDEVERTVARLRDGLIAHRRAGSATTQTGTALDRLNAVLSLIVAVEYPQGPMMRAYIEQARDTLLLVANRA
ncbi:MAG TPA: hypothetical protein VIL85_26295 [Thermomicrobiales bacterium]|jgi:hypothetical protein